MNRSGQARLNGAKSKGPTSPEGKAKSSQNAIKHGLTAKTFTLMNEDVSKIEHLVQEYCNRFRPADQVETDLITEMAGARARLLRAYAMETAMIDWKMCQKPYEFEEKVFGHDEDMRKAAAFTQLSTEKGLPHVSLYQSRLERTYHRALKALLLLQQQRKNEPEPAGEPLLIEPISEVPPTLISPPREEVIAGLEEKIRLAKLQTVPTPSHPGATRTNEPKEPEPPCLQ